MEENHEEWLPHLKSEIVSEVHGNLLDAYVLALEGWRRGLTLRWHAKESEKFQEMRTWSVDKPGQLFSLSSKDKTHYFFRTRGDKIPNEAVDIGRDKEKTKQTLQQKGILIPKGRQFVDTATNKEIIEYATNLGYPVVLKPTNGSFGQGVISNITSSDELEQSLTYVRTQLNFPDVIIEQYIPGKEYRIYVVDHEVVGAMNRVPANVIGDGIHSIKALIEIKNEKRSLNPRLVSCPILVNEEVETFIGKHGYQLDSIPENGEHIFLTDKTNISIGGDPIDVFDEISTYVKEAAVQALHAVPGLEHGAVDLIVHHDHSKAYIIELNPTANLGGLLYPIEGKSRDILKAIIDYYFPKTKKDNRITPNIYFDFHEALTPISIKAAMTTEVAHLPNKEWFLKKYLLIDKVDSLKLHQQIKEKALEQSLIGSITRVDDEKSELILGGNKETVEQFKKQLNELDEYVIIEDMDEEGWNQPMKLGFEIQAERKNMLTALEGLENQLIELRMEQRKLEKLYHNMLTSHSWKITEPVRKVGTIIKGMLKK